MLPNFKTYVKFAAHLNFLKASSQYSEIELYLFGYSEKLSISKCLLRESNEGKIGLMLIGLTFMIFPELL